MFSFQRRGRISPLWVFALVYVGYSLFFSLLRLSSLLIALGIACAAAVAVGAAQQEAKAKNQPASSVVPNTPIAEIAPKESEDLSVYTPAVQAIIQDGNLALGEMGRLSASIQNPAVQSKIATLSDVSRMIINDAKEDESDVPQIRRFLDFYMPTTLKLLNAYDRMDATELDGDTVTHSKQNIQDMLDTTITAYRKQLDALFGNQAMDIDVEIRSMKSLLEREGLGDNNPLDWNSFKEQYDQNKQHTEKGIVQNG